MKKCLITGASGDIGAAISLKMAAQGFSLYLHYYKNEKKIKEIRKKCASFGVDVKIVQANLATETGVKKLLATLTEPIDLLIYTSGNSHFGLFTEIKNEEMKTLLQLHLQSPMELAKALLPAMIANKEGNMVFISSIWGLAGASCEVVYSAVKGGLNSFVKALAKEVAPSGIRINGVAPGAIETKMMALFSEEDKTILKEEIPMQRLGTAEEVANAVAFLSSEAASYINGQILSVNGAWYT